MPILTSDHTHAMYVGIVSNQKGNGIQHAHPPIRDTVSKRYIPYFIQRISGFITIYTALLSPIRLQNSKPQFRSPNRIVVLERRPCIAKRCSSSPSTAHYMSVRKINEAPMTWKHQRAATCDETGPGLQATPPSARGRALSKHYGESARCRGALTRWHGEGEADGRSLHPDPGAPPQRHTPPVRTGSRRI